MKAATISIGTELVWGLTPDTNAAWLARRLVELGLETIEHITIADDRARIRDVFTQLAGHADVIIATGGLGPTDDDVTRHALADAMGAPLVPDPTALEALEQFFARLGRTMPPRNRIQAMIPEGFGALPNPCGTAPGLAGRIGACRVFVLPGVPGEMRAMFEQSVAPALRSLSGRRAAAMRTLHAFGYPEADIADTLADLMTPGRNPHVGTTAKDGVISVHVYARADDEAAARRLADADATEIRRRLGHAVFGEADATLASAVGGLLRARHQTVAVAESCTGGLLAEMITAVPGASDYFLAGFVTYSNQAKTRDLDVPADLIAEHGAVSEPVARAMALGALRRAGSDYALAITGIAGPAGGTPDKPVGTVFIALAQAAGAPPALAHFVRWPENLDRDAIRRRTAHAALDLLRLRLTEHN